MKESYPSEMYLESGACVFTHNVDVESEHFPLRSHAVQNGLESISTAHLQLIPG